MNERQKILLWLCGSPAAAVSEAMEIPMVNNQGWLSNMVERLMECCRIRFIYLFPTEHGDYRRVKQGSCVFISLPPKIGTEALAALLQEFQPDIIHIWGTEYPHALTMTEAAKAVGLWDQTIISVQGLVGAIAYHSMGNVPPEVQRIPTLRDILRRDSLTKQQVSFRKRGLEEAQALRNVGHVIGRTFWDRSYVRLVAPEVQYHFNNETLRESFYHSRWQREMCVQHRIFVSQTHYPLKGFHYLLDAVGLLREKYPDITIEAAGADNSFKPQLLETAYGRYLRKLMVRYGLTERVKYVGMLSEKEMLAHYLAAEVFVSASAIENSPNSVGEAMLLGMPVIASNVGGVSDLLVHGKEGFTYQADAPYLLAEYLDTLFSNPDMADQMGKNARSHAEKTHDAEKNFRTLIAIYSEVSAMENWL